MKQVKVSVIMPFHNAGAYIHETMDSICTQTLTEIEIICVDDGSEDETFSVLTEYAKKDTRMIVINQEKSNAGVARNRGLREARGDYLLFLDSDDLFEPDLLEKMYEACERDQADVCVCNADQYDTQTKERIEKPQYLRRECIPDKLPFSRNTIGKYILYFTTSVPWNKMVRRTFIEEQEIYFQDIPRANDQFFSIMVLALAKRITIVWNRGVHYRINQTDNLTTNYSETPLCSFDALLKAKNTLEERGLLEDEALRCALDNKILNLMIYSLHIQNDIEGFKQLYQRFMQGGLKQLGFVPREETYYFKPLEYRNLELMLSSTYEEYLLIKCIEYRDTISRKNDQIKKKDASLRDLRKEKKELQKKERELNYIKGTKRYKFMAKLTGFYHRLFRRSRKKA
ncbi:MAG: glycosyltransferase family 2 protein [Clostridium sp.]|nr:glycosyltransferase family 2 protein [Clostridium sp.]